MRFKETECAKMIVKCCNDALNAKSDCERAKILSLVIFYATLKGAPKDVMVKLRVAAGSTDKKRIAHIKDVKSLLLQ